MAQYHVVAVSHIDMAFVMRKEAYAEMTEVLLERIIGVLQRNPQIHFAIEQAAHYRELEKTRPDLFQKVKELLKEGRLEFMGAMATTLETNFPDGECMVRNQGMGLNWVREHLETQPHSGWLMDTFGMNPQVPQIMEQFGFKYVHADRFGGNKTPDLFQAEGLNGSRVVVIGVDGYSINVLPETQAMYFCRSWSDIDTLFEKADALEGETPKLVTYYIENEEVFSEYYLKLTEKRRKTGDWKHSTYQEYEAAIEGLTENLPVVTDDLNPEFTGTFALRSPIKTENRAAECALLTAEALHAAATQEKTSPLDDSWWEMFHCQFHDAFTGSHEDITYLDLMDKFAGVKKDSERVTRDVLGLRGQMDAVTCFNPLPFERKTWVRVPDADCAVYQDGRELPSCREGEDLYFRAELPGGSVNGFELRKRAQQNAPENLGRTWIENEYFKLTLDARHGVAKLEDRDGFCYLKDADDFLIAEEDRGGMQIERLTGRFKFATLGTIHVETARMDAMGQTIEMQGTFPQLPWAPDAKLEWKMTFSLRRGERMLRQHIRLDWNGDYTRIRLRWPLAIAGRDFYNEVPFGVVRREAYKNLPTAKGEWPVQRFAALEDGSHGVALINRGMAGAEQEGRILETTLIRAYGPGPDAWVLPTDLSRQNGQREFDFAIVPYDGGYRENDVVRLALEFNREVQAYRGSSKLAGKSLYRLEGRGVVLSGVKKAWDGSGDLVLRVYETHGETAQATLWVCGMTGCLASDMAETKGEACSVEGNAVKLQLKPYEICTVRIARN